MNLNFKFSIREISEVKDSDQTLTIPMYFTVEWEVCRVSTVSTKLPHFMTFVQENRLIIDEDHRSWSDDSTGPKNENTEEAEVTFCENLMFSLSDVIINSMLIILAN